MSNLNQYGENLDKKYNCAVVTGGAGFIGSHICEELLNHTNLKVISLDNYSAGKKENTNLFAKNTRFAAIKGDVLDEDLLRAIFEAHKPDLVFHNAASKKNICLHDPGKDLDVNGKGTLKLLQVAEHFKIKKFIHASTGSVYGEPVSFPQTEDHPVNPTSYYGVSKLAGEKYVALFNRLYGLNTTVLRYFHVYGTRQESNEFGGVVAIFLRNLLNNEQPTIHGDGTQERSFTYVKDVVKANMLVACHPETAGQVYNSASGIKININSLCKYVIEAFELNHKVEPKYGDWLIGDIKVFNVDNSKIASLGLSFEKDFQEKITEMVKDAIKRRKV